MRPGAWAERYVAISVAYTGALCATSRGIYMPETESWVSRGTSPAVEAGDCLGPISERRRYPIGAVNGAPETSVNAARLIRPISARSTVVAWRGTQDNAPPFCPRKAAT